jgi:hypothetical protein
VTDYSAVSFTILNTDGFFGAQLAISAAQPTATPRTTHHAPVHSQQRGLPSAIHPASAKLFPSPVDDSTFIFHSLSLPTFFLLSCSGFLFKIAIVIVGLIDTAFVCVQLQRSGGKPANLTVRASAANA